MRKNAVLLIAQIALVLLGITMILIGAVFSKKFILPPIITGIGFFVIAWVFSSLKTKKGDYYY